MFSDVEYGILYCVGKQTYMYDLNSGKQIGTFKGVSNATQVLCDEARETLIVMSTVGEFAVYSFGHYEEPIWKFKLKQIDNTNQNSFLQDGKIYCRATCGAGKKYFIIDLKTKEIECSKNAEDKYFEIYNEQYQQKKFCALGVSMPIPEKYKTLEYISCYYATEKFEFVGTWDKLLILPKDGSGETHGDEESQDIDWKEYIKLNGITKEVFGQLCDDDILRCGYSWVIDKLEPLRKKHKLSSHWDVLGTDEELEDDWITLYGIGLLYEEIQNGGFCQFVINQSSSYAITVAALKIVGAVKTAGAIEKAIEYYNTNQNTMETDLIGKAEEVYADPMYEDLMDNLTEDYIGLTIKYLESKSQTRVGKIMPVASVKRQNINLELTNLELAIRANGITKDVFGQLSDERILRSGFEWVLGKLVVLCMKHKLRCFWEAFRTDEAIDENWIILYGTGILDMNMQHGGFGQFISNNLSSYDITVAALKIVGAVKTAGAIEKAMEYYNTNQNSNETGLIGKAKKVYDDPMYEEFMYDLDEDYIGLTIRYLERKIKS